jgi:hypothetical protein
MLADDRRVRLGGQMHQDGLSVVVLVTAHTTACSQVTLFS